MYVTKNKCILGLNLLANMRIQDHVLADFLIHELKVLLCYQKKKKKKLKVLFKFQLYPITCQHLYSSYFE